MSGLAQTRLVNPRLGTYFGIFTTAFVALVALVTIFAELGVSELWLRVLMFATPLALYGVIAVAAHAVDPLEFFAAGRRVPAVFNGLVTATATVGGTGIVCMTGVFLINGFDGWCLGVGLASGAVAMGILTAPFQRKYGGSTLAGYMGRRFESRTLRVASAALMAVPTLLIVVAELKVGILTGGLLTGLPAELVALCLGLAVVLLIAPGGLRSLTWVGAAQSIALLIAIIVPVGLAAVALTNMPIAQLSFGPVLRAVDDLEKVQGLKNPPIASLAFHLAGQGFEPLIKRMSVPFGSVGSLSYVLGELIIMVGVAGAPWLLPRAGTTTGVDQTRKSLGWTTFFIAVFMLTISATAVFLRHLLLVAVEDHTLATLPEWVRMMTAQGFATIDGAVAPMRLAAVSVKRDAALFLLPSALGHPFVMVQLAMVGATAAALASAGNALFALGAIASEDGMFGLAPDPEPTKLRIAMARLAIATLGLTLALVANLVPADPLVLMLDALAISSSAIFPVLVLSIWWKRLNTLGALSGMLTGFAIAIVSLLMGETPLLGIPGPFAGVVGLPAALMVSVIVSRVTPAPLKSQLEVIRDIRVAGGETVYDRETRLFMQSQRQAGA